MEVRTIRKIYSDISDPAENRLKSYQEQVWKKKEGEGKSLDPLLRPEDQNEDEKVKHDSSDSLNTKNYY